MADTVTPDATIPDPAEPAYNLALFPAEAPKPAPSPDVYAPIVLDAKTEEGVRSFLSYYDALGRHSNTALAEAEERRIRPYLSAMSLYLTRAARALDPDSDLGRKKAALEAIATPQGLADVFNAMASFTRITMISDVVVMADDIKTAGPAAHLLAHRGEFNTGYDYCGHPFSFGFLRAFEGGQQAGAKSGTTLPTFMIDHALTAALPAAEAAPLVRGLQRVMTLVNHDMLHHFTSTYINPETVFSGSEDSWKRWHDPVTTWSRKIPSASFGEAYEDWAQMGQEKVMLQPGGDTLAEETRATVEAYFDTLDRVRAALLSPSPDAPATGVSAAETLQKAHEVVDYFGMVMAHALTRAFPLTHPLMRRCLDRVEQADPLPGEALKDCAKMMAHPADVPANPADPALERSQLLDAIRNSDALDSKLLPEMVKSYRNLGCEVFPDDDAAVGYRHLKMLQLMRLGGLHTHIPSVDSEPIMKIRNGMDELTLGMIAAAASTAFLSVPEDKKALFAPFEQPPTAAELALKSLGVAYAKRKDDTLVVDGDVDLSNRGLAALPDLSSVIVKGSFRCDGNELTSLAGAPQAVGRDFWCHGNLLVSLVDMPDKLGGDLLCQDNLLVSLERGPSSVGGDVICADNPLADLQAAPKSFRKLVSDLGTFLSWKDAVSPPRVETARGLYRRLEAGDTEGFSYPSYMAGQIRRELERVEQDLSALDPAGQVSAAEAENSLKALVAAAHLTAARRLYGALLAGESEDRPRGAPSLARDIRENVKNAAAGLDALDPSGKSTAEQVDKALDRAVAEAQLRRGRTLFVRLLAGDTEGFRAPENMAHEIREYAETTGLAALDADGQSTDAEVEKALAGAVSAPHLKKARELYGRLLKGDTEGFRSAPWLEREILGELKYAGAGLEALDAAGTSAPEEVAKKMTDTVTALQLACARKLYLRFLTGDREGFRSAETMVQEIRDYLESAKAGPAALDARGTSTGEQVERTLADIVAAGHTKKAGELYGKLMAGDTAGTDPGDTAHDIQRELKQAGADLRIFDASGSRTAEEMEKLLSDTAAAQCLALARALYARLRGDDTEGFNSPASMARSIRMHLLGAKADTAALEPAGNLTAEQVEGLIKETIAARCLKSAREMYARLLACDLDGNSPERRTSDIRSLVKEAGADLAALEPPGTKSDEQVDQLLKCVVSAAHITRAREMFNRLAAGDTEGFKAPVSMAHAILKELGEVKAELTALDPSGGKSARDIDRVLKMRAMTPQASLTPAPGTSPTGP